MNLIDLILHHRDFDFDAPENKGATFIDGHKTYTIASAVTIAPFVWRHLTDDRLALYRGARAGLRTNEQVAGLTAALLYDAHQTAGLDNLGAARWFAMRYIDLIEQDLSDAVYSCTSPSRSRRLANALANVRELQAALSQR